MALHKQPSRAADTVVNVSFRIPILEGLSAHRPVVTGFAAARVLHAYSFADVLDEETGRGYQRPFSGQHSLDFRRYIGRAGGTTIPLTFNLRPSESPGWRIRRLKRATVLELLSPAQKPLAQVDCQHRLGHLADSDLELPFMAFIGLSVTEEMEVFGVINGKAKGLSSSLLDYHAAHLAQDLGKERPELFIALHLNEATTSPWYKQLNLGGAATSGLKRRASLRTMQKAVRKFLTSSYILESHSPSDVAALVCDYWEAVVEVFRDEWANPRRHFLTKGIGVYAMMGLLVDLYSSHTQGPSLPNRRELVSSLHDVVGGFDWTNTGPLRGLGGETGAEQALLLLKLARHPVDSSRALVLHG